MKKFWMLLVISIVIIILTSCQDETIKTETIDNQTDIIETYTVIFNSNGGTNIPSITTDGKSTIEIPEDPLKEGFSFGGWYIDTNFNIIWTHTFINSDITVYAKWIELSAIEKLSEYEKAAFEGIIDFIEYAKFYNPSDARVISVRFWFDHSSEINDIYFIEFELQGTNQLGGTVTQKYSGQINYNENDGYFIITPSVVKDYFYHNSLTDNLLDVGPINKAIVYYWEQKGM